MLKGLEDIRAIGDLKIVVINISFTTFLICDNGNTYSKMF